MNKKEESAKALSYLTYVIFSQDLSNIGGGQRYVLWKAKLLRRMGANVLLIASETKPLVLTELLEFKHLSVIETSLHYYLFPHSVARKTLDYISTFINNNRNTGGKVLFESVNITAATWSEKVAELFDEVSLIYDIGSFPLKELALAEFVATKIERNEFMGCSRFLVHKILGNYPELIDPQKINFINVPIDQDAVDHSIEYSPSLDIEGIGILTISRIDKPHLVGIIEEVITLARIMKDQEFFLTLVLDKNSGSKLKTLQKITSEAPHNLKFFFTGPFVPLPSKLFEKHTVFVGVGTAALHAIACGLPVVIASPHAGMSSGIFGIDVFEFGYAEKYAFKISDLLFKLIETPELLQRAKTEGGKVFQTEFNEEAISKKFEEWIIKCLSKSNKEYFPFDSISLTKKEKIKKMLLTILSARAYKKLSQMKNKLLELLSTLWTTG